MLIRALLLGVAAAACVAVYLSLVADESEVTAPPRAAMFVTEPDESPPPAAAPASPADLATTLDDPASFELRPDERQAVLNSPAIRNVTPATMTAAPQVAEAPVRAEPVAAPAKPPAAARQERLFNPLVVSAGTIKAKDGEVHLADISAPEADKTCGEGANAWPCGAMARAALRRFVRGRAITCEVPAGANAIPDPARCEVGGQNLAEWLVMQGWAERRGDSFAEAEKRARDSKFGLWSETRPDQADDVATNG